MIVDSASSTTRPLQELTEPFDPVACLGDRDRRRAAEIPTPGAPGRYLQVQGPDSALLIPLGDEPLHVGRGLAADIRLDHNSVSRRHAIIIARGSRTRILDDRSLNGTFVNGSRIEHADLQDGDVIVLGWFELRFVEVSEDTANRQESMRINSPPR